MATCAEDADIPEQREYSEFCKVLFKHALPRENSPESSSASKYETVPQSWNIRFEMKSHQLRRAVTPSTPQAKKVVGRMDGSIGKAIPSQYTS